MRYPSGRTMREAREAGDWYQIMRLDTGDFLEMPGCSGIKETIEGARSNRWPSGTAVELRLILPQSSIGSTFLGEAISMVLP